MGMGRSGVYRAWRRQRRCRPRGCTDRGERWSRKFRSNQIKKTAGLSVVGALQEEFEPAIRAAICLIRA